MVQELQVLKCYSCETFQSHIVKKTNKWECKICGTKQSVKKVYGRGSGKDCRIHTQKLNALRGLKEETESPPRHIKEISKTEPSLQHIPLNECLPPLSKDQNNASKRNSKWAEFIDNNETSVNQNILNKTNEFTLPYGSKVKKRKLKDDFKNDLEEGWCLDDMHSVNENDFASQSTHYRASKKKFIINKYNISKTSNFCSVYDSHEICRESSESVNNVHSGNKRHSNPDRKLALCPKISDETNLSKIPSQNTSKLLQKSTKVSLKWAKYLDEEKDLSIPGTPTQTGITNSNHQSESKNYMGIKNTKCNEVGLESRADYSQNVACDNSSNVGFDNCGQTMSSCDFEISELQLIVPSFLEEKNPDNFVLNSKAVSSREPSFKWSSNSDYCPTSSLKTKWCKINENNNLLFDSNDGKLDPTNSLSDVIVKNEFNNGIRTNVTVSVQENYPQSNLLPVFEQNGELRDIDFQLDF